MTELKTTGKGKGFTLIEIVVILAVAAIVLPAILLPLTQGIRDLDKPAAWITMVFLAQEEMESRIITAGFGEVASWPETAIAGFPDYTSSGSVIAAADVKEVTVTVSRGDESLSLVTRKTDWQR
jgi:type II secretory pathway pseudopilin PulG